MIVFLKNKKSQSIMGMPFSVIFSILLIVFIIAASFFAIKYFLNIQKSAQVGLFIDEFKSEISESWNADKLVNSKEFFVYSSLEYICFINATKPFSYSAGSVEEEILKDFDTYLYEDKNFIIYPFEKAEGFAFNKIDKISIPNTNPYCKAIKSGKIKINFEKDLYKFGDDLVRIS